MRRTRKRATKRYSPESRQLLVNTIEHRRATRGISAREACESVGLPVSTYWKWRKRGYCNWPSAVNGQAPGDGPSDVIDVEIGSPEGAVELDQLKVYCEHLARERDAYRSLCVAILGGKMKRRGLVADALASFVREHFA